MKKLIALVLAAGFSAAALAAPETYVIDDSHTFARFSYSHLGFTTQESRFDCAKGKITIDRAAKTGSTDITIDTNSINTGSTTFNGHLKGADFFDVEKFPTITYKSTKFNFIGDALASVDGNLTIKGITKPVNLKVTSFKCQPHPMAKKDACGANATATIKRTEFNAGKYAPNVSDDVTLTFSVEAIKE
jgi:polyisoprenoid-binding protein YceI